MDLTIAIPLTLIRKSLFIALFCACSAAQATSMYKWVDDEGNIHYDQFPPPDRTAEKLKGSTSGSAQPPSKPETKEETHDQPPPAVTEDDTSRVKRQNCEAAKRNLDIYTRHNKIKQPDGSELVLSEEMREEKIQQAKEDIKNFCK